MRKYSVAIKACRLPVLQLYLERQSPYLNERSGLRCTLPSAPVKKKFSTWPPPVLSMRAVGSILTRGGGSVLPLWVERQPSTNRHGFSQDVRVPASISGGGRTSRAMS